MRCATGDIVYVEVHGSPMALFQNRVENVVSVRVERGIDSWFYKNEKSCLGSIIEVPPSFKYDYDTNWVRVGFKVRFNPDCIVYNQTNRDHNPNAAYYNRFVFSKNAPKLASKRFPPRDKLL